jgi:hypothetical protein
MSLKNKLRFAASPLEVLLVVRSAALLAAIPPLLKFMDIEKIVRNLTPKRLRREGATLPRERIRYLCQRTFAWAGRVSYHPNCLRRSLVLYHCLRAHGIPAVIHFGVKRDGDTLAGHCWLTIDGALYGDRSDMVSQFAQMFALPPHKEGPPATDPLAGAPSDIGRLSFDG